MAYRKAMKKKSSKRLFRNTAGAKKKNYSGRPMRGGIRL